MESKRAKIALYAKRSFGEKLNASFDFIRENWKPLFKFTTYLILPLCLIQALSLNGMMGGYANTLRGTQVGTADSLFGVGFTYWANYGATLLCSLVGSIVLSSLLFALVKTYGDREERLEGITLSSLKPLLFRNAGRLCKLVLIVFVWVVLFCTVMVLLAFLTPFTLILTLPLLFVCMVPMAMFAPIYLFEEIGLWEAFKKTFRLGFVTWGGIFLVWLIMGLVSSVLQGVTMLPWYIGTFVKIFFTESDGGAAFAISPVYNFFLYLAGVLQAYGMYLSCIFPLVGMVYQYGHASEVVDSISVVEDIENFDHL